MKVFLKSYGCQMAEYDSIQVSEGLKERGCVMVEDMDDADIILVNTCSVRKQVEDRVFGQLRVAGDIKERRPDIIVGMMGCMVNEHKEKLLTEYPFIDFLTGSRDYAEVIGLLEGVDRDDSPRIVLRDDSFEYTKTYINKERIRTFVPIMRGCDNACTYCVVPLVRGKEVSRPFAQIRDEIVRAVDHGVRCITLLGQNVNSYGKGLSEKMDFPDLLEQVSQIPGLLLIRFMTSHPRDMSTRLFQVMRDNPAIERHLHIPLQSGSNRILERMERGYTVEYYRDRIHEIRSMLPDVSITTDIMIGFPGETEEDHRNTVRFYEEMQFDDAFFFKYSPRRGTRAYSLYDSVSLKEKNRRVQELLALQKNQTHFIRRQLVGKAVRALVEAISVKDNEHVQCRTWTDHSVICEGSPSDVRAIITVQLTDFVNDTFIGKRVHR